MKKLSLLLIFCFLVFASAQSQGDNFGKGSSAINLGIGFGNTMYTGAYYKMGFPAVSVSYELGIVEVPMGSSLKGIVGVGGLVGVGGSKYDYAYGAYGYDVKTTYFLIAARGNYHFIFHEKFDPYAGVILGYHFGNSKVTYGPGWPSHLPRYNESDGGVHAGAYAGARWFFNPSFAVFSELGWNVAIFTIGATLKF
ncbi:MAG: hypothetical protein RQ761_11975 [Bacteroidales bacterium]|nr:hypothetical protein [Bacteroidales bacterium]